LSRLWSRNGWKIFSRFSAFSFSSLQSDGH
jgi:hypothetical protein